MASKTLIDRLSQRIDRLEAVLNPPPSEKWVVLLQFDGETDDDMRRKYKGYDPLASLHLYFDDYAGTDWPVAPIAEQPETPLESNADVPQSLDQTIDDYLSRGYAHNRC
jgi:hypothetical protein